MVKLYSFCLSNGLFQAVSEHSETLSDGRHKIAWWCSQVVRWVMFSLLQEVLRDMGRDHWVTKLENPSSSSYWWACSWCMYIERIRYLWCSVMQIQWTLTYPATTGPEHGRISEIAGYVNHHTNRAYNVSLLALPFLFLSCYPSLMQIVIVFWPL